MSKRIPTEVAPVMDRVPVQRPPRGPWSSWLWEETALGSGWEETPRSEHAEARSPSTRAAWMRRDEVRMEALMVSILVLRPCSSLAADATGLLRGDMGVVTKVGDGGFVGVRPFNAAGPYQRIEPAGIPGRAGGPEFSAESRVARGLVAVARAIAGIVGVAVRTEVQSE